MRFVEITWDNWPRRLGFACIGVVNNNGITDMAAPI